MPGLAEQITDADWVRAAQSGDPAAFEQLYRRHSRRVANTLYRLLGDDIELDALVQDTFLAAHRGLDRLQDPAAFAGWITTIAARQAQRSIGERSRFRELVRKLSREPRREAIDSQSDALRELRRLPERYRFPWVLHRIEGMTLQETADACGVSVATTKRRIREATRRLKGRLS